MAAALPVGLNLVSRLIGGAVQSSANMRLAQYQNEYNSPVNQMKRFAEAGLNPNLVYSQGNAGNMSPITPTNWQGAFGNPGSEFVQSELQQTQADVGQQKIDESKTKQAVMEAQKKVLEANPYLSPEYLNAMVTSMVANAKMKENEAKFYLNQGQDGQNLGFVKLQRELDALGQRLNLNTADQKMKAEILKSQEFQNALREIQVKWMKDGDITPQHMLNGIMLLLSKLM